MTSAATPDPWRPATYNLFAEQRTKPFRDLVALCRPVPGGKAVDLGCGTGALTAEMHRALGLSATIGVDNSSSMLAEAAAVGEAGVTFVEGDIAVFGAGDGPVDLVFSNAALQWVPADHRDVLASWASALAPGGQIAVQVPSNADHLSHLTSAEVAREEPFFSLLDGDPPADPVEGVLRPEEYAEVLYDLGFADQSVRLQVYGQVMDSTASVVDWVSGTSLTRFRRRFEPADYELFVERYRQRLLEVAGERSPYFYAFKRVLMWGQLPQG